MYIYIYNIYIYIYVYTCIICVHTHNHISCIMHHMSTYLCMYNEMECRYSSGDLENFSFAEINEHVQERS